MKDRTKGIKPPGLCALPGVVLAAGPLAARLSF
jgi:hypothetical protein